MPTNPTQSTPSGQADLRIKAGPPTREQRDRDQRVLSRLFEVLPLVSPEPDVTDFMSGAAVALLVLREDENRRAESDGDR